jgi:hypothetical protein
MPVPLYQLGDVVGDEGFGADFGGIDDEGGVVGERDSDGGEGGVPIGGIRARESTKGDV